MATFKKSPSPLLQLPPQKLTPRPPLSSAILACQPPQLKKQQMRERAHRCHSFQRLRHQLQSLRPRDPPQILDRANLRRRQLGESSTPRLRGCGPTR